VPIAGIDLTISRRALISTWSSQLGIN